MLCKIRLNVKYLPNLDLFFIFIAIQKTAYHLEATDPTMIKLRQKSHRYLRIRLYLLDNVKRATVYVTNDCTKRKL